MSDVAGVKRQIRRATIDRILAMPRSQRDEEDAALAERFPRLPGWQKSRSILLYARAFPEEIETEPFLKITLDAGKRLVCPRVDRRSKSLKLFEIGDPSIDFEVGTLGIPEPRTSCPAVDPTEVDWVLVPGLAFDSRGYRVGRGAGHYDRLLPKLRDDVLCWALIYDAQWFDELPVEPHDVPVDGVVSRSRSFGLDLD